MKRRSGLLKKMMSLGLALAIACFTQAESRGQETVRLQFNQAAHRNVLVDDLLLEERLLPPGSVIEVPLENYKQAEAMPYWSGTKGAELKAPYVKGVRVVSVPGYSKEEIDRLNAWLPIENLYMSKSQLSQAIVVGPGSDAGGGSPRTMRLQGHAPILRNDGRLHQRPSAAETAKRDAQDATQAVDQMNEAMADFGKPSKGVCTKDNYRKILNAGVPKKALDLALARLGPKRDRRIKRTDYIAIADFTQPSNRKRLFVINLKTGEVEAMITAHGRGKGSQTNSHLKAKYFGGRDGSYLTPAGFHVTSGIENSQAKGLNLRMHGLEARNARSAGRGILLHATERRKLQYVSEAFVRATGHAGRSEGCLTIDPPKLRGVLDKLKGGALIYNYTGQD